MLKGRAAEAVQELCYNDHAADGHVHVEAKRRLQPRTPEGRVTVAILHMNDPERVLGSQLLLQIGRYP